MALMDFFRKKTDHPANTTSQSSDPDVYRGINESLITINESLVKISESLAENNERLRKVENRQKETGLQLEEIDGFLQGGGNEPALVDALIALTDTIGDFYYFAAADRDSPLYEQAMMMWNTAINAAEEAGLEMIDAACEPFDFSRHSVENVEQNDNIPNGYVIKTLKCGYVYRDEIIRRATVVVNKISAPIIEEAPIQEIIN